MFASLPYLVVFLGMNPNFRNFDLLHHLIQLTWRIIILAFVQPVPLSNNFGVNCVILVAA